MTLKILKKNLNKETEKCLIAVGKVNKHKYYSKNNVFWLPRPEGCDDPDAADRIINQLATMLLIKYETFKIEINCGDQDLHNCANYLGDRVQFVDPHGKNNFTSAKMPVHFQPVIGK